MTCRDARRRMIESFDRTPVTGTPLDAHLGACAECAREYAGLRESRAALEPARTVRASAGFKERVMNELNSRISADAVAAPRRIRFPRWLAVAAAAGAIIIALPIVGTFTREGKAPLNAGAAVFAQSADALSNLRSIHIKALIRSVARDNFEFIQLDAGLIPVELRREFTPVDRWRVEKPGRVVVMDGDSSTLFIEPATAARGGKQTGFVQWLRPLLDPQSILRGEFDAVQAGRAQAAIAHENGAMILRVRRSAAGIFDHPWARNTSIAQSDHTCIYRFDEQSKKLLGLEVVVHAGAADVPVFQTTLIQYDQAFDPALFRIALPPDVNWGLPPEQMPVTNVPLPQTAREAAVVFLEACASQDWNALLAVYPYTAVSEPLKRKCDGLKVLSIGEPFRSGLFAGTFVPYEIRLKDGSIRKWNLAVRNDNAAGRWRMDGGF
ncbi:MAG TPA: hypothetical protein VFL57_00370 [Bryobacteraceae bacterium]|nr:hypothetical protein [Bryobacteraceae bacterium]